MKKKFLALVCALSVTLSLTACGNNESGSSSQTSAPAASSGAADSAASSATDSATSSTADSAASSATDSATSSAADSAADSTADSDTSSAADSATSGTESTPEGGTTVSHELSNKNSDETTKKVYDYLCDIYGKQMLTGQMEAAWNSDSKGNKGDQEMEMLETQFGKLPALRGLDYINDDFAGVNERAKAWWEKGGLVTICWHTGVDASTYDASKADTPDIDKLLTDGTEENKTWMAKLDKVAEALAELQEAGVPVLWRPFHELDGGWFWWSKSGPEGFKKVWTHMYDYFTNEKKLNNLIWVLGYSGKINEFDSNGDGEKDKIEWKEWYVGDEYCDIVGSDTYDFNKNDAGGRVNKTGWDLLDTIGSSKPRAFHECGRMGNSEDFKSTGCTWLWFMVWHNGDSKEYVKKANIDHNLDNFKDMYENEFTVTLDELPDWN